MNLEIGLNTNYKNGININKEEINERGHIYGTMKKTETNRKSMKNIINIIILM